MGLHHFTDYICSGCQKYSTDVFESCCMCEDQLCKQCLTKEEAFFLRVCSYSSDEDEDTTRNDEDMDYHELIRDSDFKQINENEDSVDEADEERVLCLNIWVCGKCMHKKEKYCDCCTETGKQDLVTCSCSKMVCGSCSTRNSSGTVFCWLCTREKPHFANWLCTQMQDSHLSQVMSRFYTAL